MFIRIQISIQIQNIILGVYNHNTYDTVRTKAILNNKLKINDNNLTSLVILLIPSSFFERDARVGAF